MKTQTHQHPLRIPMPSKAWFAAGIIAAVPFVLQSQPADPESEPDVFVLSPFEVKADDNMGYLATSSLAGSRLNTDLKDVASAISVVTLEFFDDTASVNLQDILIYQTSAEVSGIGGNYYGSDANDAGYRNRLLVNPQTGTRLRGDRKSVV